MKLFLRKFYSIQKIHFSHRFHGHPFGNWVICASKTLNLKFNLLKNSFFNRFRVSWILLGDNNRGHLVGGSRTRFFTIIFGIFPKVELPTSRYFENSQSLGILISQRLGNIPIFGKFQFPTIRRNFHIFSIAYLREHVSLHFFVQTPFSILKHVLSEEWREVKERESACTFVKGSGQPGVQSE